MYEVEFTDMNEKKEDILKTDIDEFDQLFANGGIPNGNSVLVAGGPGTGKSTLCRQICYTLL
jgi:KaiC/GvpD/RAD55 family RecA-like ATPase